MIKEMIEQEPLLAAGSFIDVLIIVAMLIFKSEAIAFCGLSLTVVLLIYATYKYFKD